LSEPAILGKIGTQQFIWIYHQEKQQSSAGFRGPRGPGSGDSRT